MSSPFSRAPHARGVPGTQPQAPNAALLIDFDNVTMGMRSDLSKELANLLNSDIIKGKVTVQRAYADWRRYPQYIVPLSENSVDLIFAPAYGSSKKNATDIRMAIDAIELVFIRPEIGTFILLTGDSDFSSLVLKLKEYGKYVVGVGIQESSSDILVQNCDEYYSYTSLTGLRKTTDSENKPVDPWVLVEQAVARMASREDVMRSDRLKQVMIEIDPTFDEGNFGFSKFSKFLSEAGSRELVTLRKLENGQYEVLPSKGGQKASSASGREDTRKASGRGRHGGRDQEERGAGGGEKVKEKAQSTSRGSPRGEQKAEEESSKGRDTSGKGQPEKKAAARPPESEREGEGEDPLKRAYAVMTEALAALSAGDGRGGPVRDSDLKRKMLQMDPAFDEGELGFGKFSRFLRQAHDHEVVDLQKRDDGTYQVSPRGTGEKPQPQPEASGQPTEGHAVAAEGSREAGDDTSAPAETGESPLLEGVVESGVSAASQAEQDKDRERSPRTGGLGVRRGGSRFWKAPDGPPPLLEGQVVTRSGTVPGPSREDASAAQVEAEAQEASRRTRGSRGKGGGPRSSQPEDAPPEQRSTPDKGPAGSVDFDALGLPTDDAALIRYLTNSYKGVGRKTAEKVVEEFGFDLFRMLHEEPGKLESVVRADRLEQLVQGWKADLARRQGREAGEIESSGAQSQDPKTGENGGSRRRRTRRGGRARGGSGAGKTPEARG